MGENFSPPRVGQPPFQKPDLTLDATLAAETLSHAAAHAEPTLNSRRVKAA